MHNYRLYNEEIYTILLTTLFFGTIITCPGPWHDESMEDPVWSDFRSYGNVSYRYLGKPLRTWSEARQTCQKQGKGATLATPSEAALSNSKSPWSSLLKDLQDSFGDRAVQAPWTSVRQKDGSWQTNKGDDVDSNLWLTPPIKGGATPSQSSNSTNSTDQHPGRCAFLFMFSPKSKGSLGSNGSPAGLLDGDCIQERAVLCQRGAS